MLHAARKVVVSSCCVSRHILLGCRPLLALLGDSTHAVKAAIAKNIGVTVEQFQSASEDMRTKANAELLPALVTLESGCALDWRMQLDILSSFPAFAQASLHDSSCTSQQKSAHSAGPSAACLGRRPG